MSASRAESDQPGAVPIYVEHLEALLAVPKIDDERVLLRVAAESVAQLLGERASCVLVDGMARVALSTASPALVDWPIDLVNYPEISSCIAQRAAITVKDVRSDPLLAGVRARLPSGLRSITVVPLLTAEGCLGVLSAQSDAPRPHAPEALATALLVAGLSARLTELSRRKRTDARTGDPLLRREAAPRGPRRLLIVDDDASLAAELAALLRAETAYEVSIAPDGEAALRLAKTHPPDLILLDVMMPVLDGFTVAERLAEDPETCDVPLLFLSGSSNLSTRIRGLKLHAADFLSKPFTVRELRARIERSMQHLAQREGLRQAAYTDELTGLGNLRVFHDRLAIEEARSARYGTPFALAVVDVDHLKRLNDEHGHAAGSEAIKLVAHVLSSGARAMDVPVRYGGDEFVVLLPHSTLHDGQRYAQRVLERLRARQAVGLTVTVSIGVAATTAGQERSLAGLLEKADAALYRAKSRGGDRVCLHEPGAPDRVERSLS